jgi:hypothetical protein
VTQISDYIVPPQKPDPDAPQGESDKRDRDEWLLLAALTLSDIPDAESYWRRHAPPYIAGMLLNEDGWRFDAERQQFVNGHGRAIAPDMLKRIALAFAFSAQQDMEHEASRVAVGEVPVDAWKRNQADDVQDLFIVMAAMGAGGFDALTKDDLDLIIGSADAPGGLAFSLSRLYEFAKGIADGTMTGEDAIINRAGLYAAAGNTVFETVSRASHMEATDEQGRPKFLLERNVLSPADHCGECPSLTEAGWLPIGSMPVPGLRECGPNCKCFMEYSLVGDAADSL